LSDKISTRAASSFWGLRPLPPRPSAANLDFIRGNLFDPAAMRPLPADATGPDNDLANLLDHYVSRATGDPTIVAYVFGQRWGPEAAVPDKVFGFRPGNGVHDVHMNQGNSGRFIGDDGLDRHVLIARLFSTSTPRDLAEHRAAAIRRSRGCWSRGGLSYRIDTACSVRIRCHSHSAISVTETGPPSSIGIRTTAGTPG